MTKRRSRNNIGKLSLLIAAFMSFRIALTVEMGASSGSDALGISDDYYCSDDDMWKGKDVTRQDCFAAIGLFFRSEVARFGNKDFEFLSARAIPRLGDWMRTPRRYTTGECVDSL